MELLQSAGLSCLDDLVACGPQLVGVGDFELQVQLSVLTQVVKLNSGIQKLNDLLLDFFLVVERQLPNSDPLWHRDFPLDLVYKPESETIYLPGRKGSFSAR
jgi:hypothetical protein